MADAGDSDSRARALWLPLWRRVGAAGDALAVFGGIATRYGEPHRAYHTLSHVVHTLRQFLPHRSLARDADAVEMALWYHDVVYDPRVRDNEDRSAEAAIEEIHGMGLTPTFGARVADLIRTTTHDVPPTDPDAALTVDADLAILGADADEYDAYESAVRREYSWVPADAYRAGRIAVLERFLGRGSIFSTAAFRETLEPPARMNLERALSHLGRV